MVSNRGQDSFAVEVKKFSQKQRSKPMERMCVCGHLESEHEQLYGIAGLVCFAETEKTLGNGKKVICECLEFVAAEVPEEVKK
jgi:hypothetical protein